MKKISFCFLLLGCFETKTNEIPLARVDSAVLLEGDIIKNNFQNIKTKEKTFEFIENWVTEEVLLKEAKKEGYLKDEQLKEKRDLFYKNLIISSYIENVLSQNITVSKKEILDYYNSSKSLFFRNEDEVFVHHFFSKELEQSRAIKRELIKKNNKKRTEELKEIFNMEAKIIKKDFSIKKINSELFKNDKMGIVGPIRSDHGFHVFDIIKRYKKGSKIGLENSYDEIYQRLIKKKKAIKRQSLIDSLKSNTNIFINSKYKKKIEN
tara:strand:- start:707 stop:1501 length:795 start_codon:yes stop_codon:yes gene_type:complete